MTRSLSASSSASSPTSSSPASSTQAAKPASDYGRELDAARAAAMEAGAILKRYWSARDFKVASKGRDNPVTTADFEADRRLRELLSGAFPAYGWLSEETVDNPARLTRERVWIVDPLDGTKEFIKGIPEFVVAIALAERGVPVVGVTYNPIKDELFWAAAGRGCHLGEERVTVTPTRTLDHATILASRSETARGEWKAYEGRVTINPIGSVAYKLALVAAGQADATFTLTPKSEWDIASGVALLLEAGGQINDLDRQPMVFNRRDVKLNGFVASNRYLHEAIERMLPADRRP